MAEREGWEIRPEREFTDEAYSAYHGDRGPGLAAARALAASLAADRRGCILVAQHSDRSHAATVFRLNTWPSCGSPLAVRASTSERAGRLDVLQPAPDGGGAR